MKVIRSYTGGYDTYDLRQALITATIDDVVVVIGSSIVFVDNVDLGDVDTVDGILRTLNGEGAAFVGITDHNVLSGLQGGVSGNYFHAHNDGTHNIFLGADTSPLLTTGSNNVFLGYRAGYLNQAGYENTFIGSESGYNTISTNGRRNTFVGYRAGYSNTSKNNTFLGVSAGHLNNSGEGNTFIGHDCGYSNQSSDDNVFIGKDTGYQNTAGNNVFIGRSAGQNNTTSGDNTYIGKDAGRGGASSTGANNVLIGRSAGYKTTTSNSNVLIGKDAGYNNIAGNSNIFLGYQSGYNELSSNKLYISNSNTTTPLIYGEFDNSILNINGKLGVGVTGSILAKLHIANSNDQLMLEDIDGGTDEKKWMFKTDSGVLSLIIGNDAWSGGWLPAFQITRSGTSITSVAFPNGSFNVVGIFDQMDELLKQYLPSETSNDVITQFTLPDVWKAGHIVVYVDGIEQLNGTDVDVITNRATKKISFTTAPPTGSAVWARYVKDNS